MTRLLRILLYLTFIVYHVVSFIFTILVDGHLDLLALLKYIPLFKYFSCLGLILIIVDFIWFWSDHRANEQRQEELQKENTELKAKIHDSQESEKKGSAKVK